jgi:cytochrome c553
MKALVVLMVVIFTSFPAFSAGNLESGAKLYKKCIACHGKDGMGKKSQKAPMIAGQYDWYIKSQVTAIKTKKRNNANTKKMYPFVKKLSDQDIDDLAAYISGLKFKK